MFNLCFLVKSTEIKQLWWHIVVCRNDPLIIMHFFGLKMQLYKWEKRGKEYFLLVIHGVKTFYVFHNILLDRSCLLLQVFLSQSIQNMSSRLIYKLGEKGEQSVPGLHLPAFLHPLSLNHSEFPFS